MKTLKRIPKRLPSEPVLIREYSGFYAIWTGRSWFGSVYRATGLTWMLQTPARPSEIFETFAGARKAAECVANRAEGRM